MAVAASLTPLAVARARWALAFVFLINGSVIGSWAPHIPLIKERLALDPALLGTALLGMAVGGLLAMPLTGGLVARFGSAAVTRAALLLCAPALLLPVLAPSLPALMLALMLFGATHGVVDVAMNAHGVAVERRLGRPVMSSYHGMFSLGGLLGAGLGGLVLGMTTPSAHALLVALGCTAASLAVLPGLLPSSIDVGASGPAFVRPRRGTLGLGALAFLALMGEGAILEWSGVFLREDLATSPSFAALGFAAFSAAMAIGRFSGDALRARVGAVRLSRASGVLAAGGLATGLALGSPWAALAGFACAGLGLANLVPILFGAAGRLPGEAPATSIAAVATLGYTGFLAGPPLMGFVAQLAGLTASMAVIALACGVLALGASGTRHADRADPALEPASHSR